MQYSVPFEWGSLHVSETAHSTYGLVPFAPTQPGYIAEKPSKGTLHTRIFLVTPGEMDMPADLPWGAAVANPRLNKNGLDYVIALGDSQQDTARLISEFNKNIVLQSSELNPEELDEYIAQDQEAQKYLEEQALRDAPQFVIHGIAVALVPKIINAAETWKRVEVNRRFYKRIRFAGVYALVGAGLIAVTPLFSGDHMLNATNIGVGAAYVGYETNIIRNLIKRNLANANNQENSIELFGRKHAAKVVSDIHDIYCRTHCDEQFAASLSPEDI